MELKLKRTKFEKNYTEGKLYINGKYFCDTIEDTERDLPLKCPTISECKCKEKVYGETAILRGIYKVILSFSNRFKKILPEILNVEHFKGIRIHGGNKAEDSHGCILLGIKSKDGEVLSSQITIKKFILLLEKEKEITINIE